MNKEMLEILTPEGKPTGVIMPRDEIHKDGSWHYSVHVWIADHGNVLLQKRSMRKESYAGFYDCGASGHVVAGETCAEGAVRELREELGIKISKEQLIFVGAKKLCYEEKPFISNEYNYIYVVNGNAETFDIRIQEEEVDEVRWIEIEKLRQNIISSEGKYCIDLKELEMVERMLRSETAAFRDPFYSDENQNQIEFH